MSFFNIVRETLISHVTHLRLDPAPFSGMQVHTQNAELPIDADHVPVMSITCTSPGDVM